MQLITYDVEVTTHDWLVTFKDKNTGQFTCIWNDSEALRQSISDDCIYVGFNSKHYDQHIIKAIVFDFSPTEIKRLSDYIIAGGQAWDYPGLGNLYFPFNNVDIRDDMQQGLSLKAIEGHLGLPIQESTVSFDIGRPLTADERAEMEYYCKHDVDTAEMLIDIRKDYLRNKINLGRLAGINEIRAMGMTNAKLTAAMLKATKTPHDDERQYVYPENLKREHIPQEVFDFFNRMYDSSISDDELFKSKFNLTIGNCPVTLGFGGIHGAILNFFWKKSDNRDGIYNADVGSYYPHLCTINGYTSRNIPDPKIYADVLDRRMKAKADGDKQTANALKLVCNTTYGAMLNQYNDLYDPLMGRSVCISGQLYLLELAFHLYNELSSLEIVQLNTDGIMFKCSAGEYPEAEDIMEEWQYRTRFDLEEDHITAIAQKDVNNYIEVQEDGAVKSKGGYLVKGVAPAGAFNVNNSCCIVATALREFLVNGIPVEETINNCNDIFQFQIIAKAGAKYREAYHMVDGEKQSVQKVNRVYATADERYGKLFKVKAENDMTAKIESLPEHCIIDNNNELSIEDVDKSFYIDMAKKRVNDFMGIKPEKKRRKAKMTTTTPKVPLNVFQKLIKAREMFLNSEINQSGKNMQLSFKYFELKDIVPTVTKIFNEVGLIALDNFTDTTATITVVNTENPEESIPFSMPFNPIQPIVSNAGKQVTNDMQALGASVTYVRRYLYQIAMDICVNDEIEPSIDATTNKPAKANTPAAVPTADTTKKKIPVTAEQRKEVKKELTATDENATALQIKGLKNVLKKLRAANPDKEDFIAEIAVQTNGFTAISKTDCEALISKITDMLEGGAK